MRNWFKTLALGCGLLTGGSLAAPPIGSPLDLNGRLQVCGTTLCNESGEKVQLAGMSSHGLSWYGQYMNSKTVSYLVSDWGISVIRGAMYPRGYDGYLNNVGKQSGLEGLIDTMVTAAEANGIYAVIDWHVLYQDNDASTGNPVSDQAAAITFFQKMATKYKGKKHVFYEICNEPSGPNGTWANIKSYAKAVIPAIRAIDPKAVIIVGTPMWDQDVDVVADAGALVEADVTSGGSSTTLAANVMYALHFYAAEHKAGYRVRANKAINKGMALFVTEWGTTMANGSDAVDTVESTNWINWMAANKISWANWSISNKSGELSAVLLSSVSSYQGGWTTSQLTQSGNFIRNQLRQHYANNMQGGPFTLSFKAGNGGTVAATPVKDLYNRGDILTLTATPVPGYVFAGWSGNAAIGVNPARIEMIKNLNLQGDFLAVSSVGSSTLTNGDFANGTNNWNCAINGATGSCASSGGTLTASISAGGADYGSVQVVQNVSLTQGTYYQLSFDAWGAANRPIYVNVGSNGGTSYSNWAPIQISTTQTSYSMVFKAPATDGSARLEFNLGTRAVNVNLDNVSFKALTLGNQRPIAYDTVITVTAGKSYTVGLQAKDVDGSVVTPYVILDGAKQGTSSLSGTTLSYTASQNAKDSVRWTVTDNSGAKDTGRVYLNHAPTVAAALKDVAIPRSSGVTVIAIGSAFSDVDGDALRYSVVNRKAKLDTVTVNGSNMSIKLVPAAFGKDTLVVTATDGYAAVTDTFVLSVTHANILPTLRDTTLNVGQDSVVKIRLAAIDTDGVVLSYKVVTAPKHGTATFAKDTLKYQSSELYIGTDTLYVAAVDDSAGVSKNARVALKVVAANHPPKVTSALPDLVVKRNAVVPSIDLSKNFTDIDGNTLYYSVTHRNALLTPKIASNTSILSLTLTANAIGKDTLYVKCGDTKATTVDTFTVTVVDGNAAPVFRDTALNLAQGGTVAIRLSAIDADGAVTSYAIDSMPTKGTATLSGSTLTYVGSKTAVGNDTLYLVAKDDSGATSLPARIIISVVVANKPPVAKGLPDMNVVQGATLAAINLASYFTDPEGASLSFSASGSEGGSVDVSLSGSSLSLVPAGSGDDYVIVKVSDGTFSVADTFKVVVAPAGSTVKMTSVLPDLGLAPYAVKLIDLSKYFSTTSGKALSYVVNGAPGGAVDATVSGSSLTLKAGGAGSDLITVVVSDGGSEMTTTFSIEVIPNLSIVAKPSSSRGGLGMETGRSVTMPRMTLPMNGALDMNVPFCADEEECQSIAIAMGYPGKVNVDIFDQLGTPVISWSRNLSEADLAMLQKDEEGRRMLVLNWNLRSSSGRLVASSVYLWKVRITAKDGTMAETVLRQGVSLSR